MSDYDHHADRSRRSVGGNVATASNLTVRWLLNWLVYSRC